jgi:hypothetical protein
MSVPKSRTAPNYNNQRDYLPDLTDQLKLYDESLCRFLTQMRFDYGSVEEADILPLRVIKASPERAFADIRDRSDTELTVYEESQDQLPLPIASFTRTDLTVDMTRFKAVTNRSPLNMAGIDNFLRKDKDERFTHRWPLPYNISYQVDFWARNESTLDSIRVWLMLKFIGGTYMYLPTDFRGIDRVYGVQNVFTQFGGISDTSDLEAGTEPRVERATTTFDVQGWILFPVDVVKTVLCTEVNVFLVPDILELDDPAACDDSYIVETVSKQAS